MDEPTLRSPIDDYCIQYDNKVTHCRSMYFNLHLVIDCISYAYYSPLPLLGILGYNERAVWCMLLVETINLLFYCFNIRSFQVQLYCLFCVWMYGTSRTGIYTLGHTGWLLHTNRYAKKGYVGSLLIRCLEYEKERNPFMQTTFSYHTINWSNCFQLFRIVQRPEHQPIRACKCHRWLYYRYSYKGRERACALCLFSDFGFLLYCCSVRERSIAKSRSDRYFNYSQRYEQFCRCYEPRCAKFTLWRQALTKRNEIIK